MKASRPLLLFAVASLLGACEVDTVPSGLRATPPGDGPLVRFEPTHRPLPEIPLPNDLATFPDPTSRTGRRLNVSLVAPTSMERRAREDFSTMEGWGVSAPITVAFERTDRDAPALDLEAIEARMDDAHDPANDPVYLVNLTTGIPVLVDVGSGYYPNVVRDPFRYGPNDPKANEPSLLFETTDEGVGPYRPDLDRDFDGVLDRPNGGRRTWYERESDTLILRPLLPLEEKTEYAVVLTDRLRGNNGQPIRSPFSAIHHPAQRAGVTHLRDWLSDRRLTPYYGDLAGTGLDHVAFAWTFTTQPTHEDLRLLRDGLYGKGPFKRFQNEFPAQITVAQTAGIGPANEEQPPNWQTSSDACRERAKTPWILKPNDPDVKDSVRRIFQEVFSLDVGGVAALESAFGYIDHIVVGSFKTPFLMGDPASRDPDTRFHLDFKTGQGDVRSDVVQWVLVVPKINAERRQPFPVATWGHGVTGHADEVLLYAGDFARQGIALIGYNYPGHGLVLGEGDQKLASAILSGNCVVPFLGAFTGGRAHDVNGDGVADSGGFWWTAHLLHTRDNVRQGILDGMQLVRILRTFDGRPSTQDLTGDGSPDIAGDFDLDGIPDVGGPNVSYFAAGESLGGIMSQIQGGIEPWMIAAAPVSGGGRLAADVVPRSYGIVESVTAQVLGPYVFAVPASERTDKSRCAGDQRSVRIEVNDAVDVKEIELACLGAAEIAENMTIVATNITAGEIRCARSDRDGRFRIPLPTSTGDRLDIQIYTAPDVVDSYAGCHARPDAPIGRRIATFEIDGARFREAIFPIDTPLVAPNEGLGLRRQSPELRRFVDLGQAAFDPADPIVFAPYYALKPLFDENGQAALPHALLNINTVGDNFVNVAAGLTFARAAGALPFLPPDAVDRLPEYADYATPRELYERLGRRTPMQFLVDNGVVDGVARLGRTSAGPSCRANYRADATCTKSEPIDPNECATALYDADWVSEGRMPYDQPRPVTPLRLARVSNVRITDSTKLASAWEPRLRGVPFGPDEAGWTANERVIGLLDHYITPTGAHTWSNGDSCRAWDFATYGNALMARFFASGGRDIYYLSHPKTHGCLVDGSCAFFQ